MPYANGVSSLKVQIHEKNCFCQPKYWFGCNDIKYSIVTFFPNLDLYACGVPLDGCKEDSFFRMNNCLTCEKTSACKSRL